MDTPNERNATLAGLLLAAWGGGALIGSLLAYLAVGRWPLLVLARTAWLVYALPVWALLAHMPPLSAATLLVISGFGNGLRNPPVQAAITLRVPATNRSQAMTAFSSVATAGGLTSLGATGVVTEVAGLTVVFAGIAGISTAGAIFFTLASVKWARQSTGIRPVAPACGPDPGLRE